MRKAVFEARNGCQKKDLDLQPWSGILLNERNFLVKGAVLDHGISCLGFRLEERFKININSSELQKKGLTTGPWLSGFKDAVIRDEPGQKRIRAMGTDGSVQNVTVENLKGIYHRSRGHVIAYVVDAADTPGNEDKIIGLAQNADLLYIEAAFARTDRELAQHKRHLTADRAGELAALAGAEKARLIHLSPRYQGKEDQIIADAVVGAGGDVKIEPGWKGKLSRTVHSP
jgi:ribonuclease Z